jgi:four helix bundle protein
VIWKDSVNFALKIYKATSSFPKEESYGMTSQLRRAAVSVPVNIGEGAARNASREFIRFLRISFGSLSEIETLLIIARDLGMINNQDYKELQGRVIKISSQISGLIKSILKHIKQQQTGNQVTR